MKVVMREIEMVGRKIRDRCPKCRLPLLSDGRHIWCTFAGSERNKEPACDFILDIRPYEEVKI